MAAWVVPAITAGAQIISSLLQNHFNKKAVRDMNQYNSPHEQMLRYAEAGLNPNLIYGQGSPGNQSQPVQYDVPFIDPMALKNKAMALELMDQQKRQNEANIGLTYSKQFNEDYKAIVSRFKGLEMSSKSPYFGEMAKYSRDAQKLRLRQTLADISNKKATLLNLQMDNQIKQQIQSEKAFYKKMREDLGIEKGDNIIFRGGASMFQRIKEMSDKFYGN